MLRKCIVILTLFISQFSRALFAQEIPHFLEKLTIEEGLSSNNITDLVQDDNGFLWIATSDGLNRFDGTEVTQYFYQNDANSIPHNFVYCLKKLPRNYLAIGTHSGLSFYNGNTGVFQNFYHQQNSPLDEYNNTIITMEIDKRGNLWVGSRNCIYIFDVELKLKKIIPSMFTQEDAIRERLRFVEKILPLDDGNVLLYLYNGWHLYSASEYNILKLENSPLNARLHFLNDLFKPDVVIRTGHSFSYSHVFKIFERYFLCIKPGADSLLLYNEQGKMLGSCYFPYNKYPYVSWSHRVAMIDSTRLLFLFHNYGLAMIALSWENNSPVIKDISQPSFEFTEFGNAICDRQGNWWLATVEEGLQKISPNKQFFKSKMLVNDSSGKPIKYEVVSASRYNNKLWIGTYGDGFFEIDLLSGKQKQYRIYSGNNETIENFIWNLRQVSADTLWVGTQLGMYWYKISTKNYGRLKSPGKPPVMDSVAITTQFVDSHGLVWMGLGKGKGLCYFDKRNGRFTYYPGTTPGGYPLRYPTGIAEDKKGNLWFVNDASTVLVYWTRNTNQFQLVHLPATLHRQLSNLSGILVENDSILWLGSVTTGLIRFHIPTGAVSILGHDKGLANSHVSSIYKDKSKRLWLVTDGGLSCFDQRTGSFTNYSTKDGLPVKYSTAFFYYDTADRRLYNGGHGAYYYFDPDRMSMSQRPQQTMITAMRVNNEPYMLNQGETPKFKAKQNDITIHYAAIDLSNGPQTKYAYRLIGEDTGWIMAGNQRQINFSRLAPGKYTFMVRAANNSGIWSQQSASISFSIRPPFTQTAWFYLLLAFGMAGIFYSLYRFRLRQLMRTEQIRTEISRNLHDEVGSTLTNISLGSLLAQKQLHNEEAVGRILERIYQDSQNISVVMREIVWSINPEIDTLGEALPRMLHYASELLEAKDINLQPEIAPEIEKMKLSMEQRRDIYLIFKEAVNNLARHSRAKQAFIRFNLSDNILIMVVADDGKGFDMSTPVINNGLKNMRERARTHHWQLGVQSRQGAGTTITLRAGIA